MTRKSIFSLLCVLIALSMVLGSLFTLQADPANAATDTTWYGAWQMGPELDAGLFGCDPGDGFARHTAIYYQPHNRVYILGARCENNSLTTGSVFYFDLATRTYGQTGTSMPVPVSNYQIATVPDDGTGNGPGFYIVGGRTANGTQSTATQVYYPETNTAINITSDPYPPDGTARSPGGVVFAAGKIYVFGGFDGTIMFADTHTYDPAAPAGARWVNLNTPLPTLRSYIATVAVGDRIYAIGGDEFIDGMLVPINDTLVLEVDNLAAGWQDDLMADLPAENGDAPAIYVDEGYLGGESGGIFMLGGHFYNIDRWVWRYDMASDIWESFPELAIPEPATGRRNMGVVYVPYDDEELGINGLGDGSAGLWVFGGFDGEGGDTMTGSSEFFSMEDNPFLLLPVTQQHIHDLGETAFHTFNILNLSGETDTYDLSFTADVDWDVTLPDSVGPVENELGAEFVLQIEVPLDESCPSVGNFTVTAVSRNDPLVTDSETVRVIAACNVSGFVYDATTGLPISNAYVWMEDPSGLYLSWGDAYTDENGYYYIGKLIEPEYYMYTSAIFHQVSLYPLGWPEGAESISFSGLPLVVDFSLLSSEMTLSTNSVNLTVPPGTSTQAELTITNTGTGPLIYDISLLGDAFQEPAPQTSTLPVPGLPRLDPQLFTDLANSPDGTADFVVVLSSQADLRGAQSMTSWEARGEYVYRLLKGHAEGTQQGVRRLIQNSGASYEPISIINAVIVYDGDLALVNSLARRSDVAQIVANREIEVEQPMVSQSILSPEAIPWNIAAVKADQVWHQYAVIGEGIVVANIDTGVQWDHPALMDSYRGWDGTTAEHNYNWYDPYNQLPDEPGDLNGHGTHTMGTMVGADGPNRIGMAPGATWIACKGGYWGSNSLLTDELLQCADWILAPTDLEGNNPDPSMRPHVVNNSWGGSSGDYWYAGVIDNWRAAGIFPMFSNGNAGPTCTTSGSPGDYWQSFSAGASTIDDQIAGFSSRGPALFTGTLKPDITAPGDVVNSSLPDSTYGEYSGTSMASPHVAGAVALLWSSNPELIGQIELTQWVLTHTAVPKFTDEGCGGDLPDSHPNNTYGWGLLDIYAAVTKAREGGLTPTWLTLDALSGVVEPDDSVVVTLNFTADVDMIGDYLAALWLFADDPYQNEVVIPVTMTVAYKFNLPLVWRAPSE